MQHDSKAVANALLLQARHFGYDIDVIKLQKLLYYAHGWYLAMTKLPLISEPVEAREFGVVIPSIHLALRQHGIEPISALFQEFDAETSEWIEPDVASDVFATMLIEKIITTYGNCTTVELSNLTHQTDSLWFRCRENKQSTVQNEMLMKYFVSLVVKGSDNENQSFFNIKLKDIHIDAAELNKNPDELTLKELSEYRKASQELQLDTPKQKWKDIVSHAARWDYFDKRGTLRLSLEDGVTYELTIPSPRELKALLKILRQSKKVKYNIVSGTLKTDWQTI